MPDMYYIDITAKDYQPGGKYWQPPLFRVGYGDAIPVVVSMDDYEIPDGVKGLVEDAFASALTRARMPRYNLTASDRAWIKSLPSHEQKNARLQVENIYRGIPLALREKYGTPAQRAEFAARGRRHAREGSTALFAPLSKLGSATVHLANTVAKGVTSIPVVGDIVTTATGIIPIKAISRLASGVLRGERLDQAFLNAGKAQIASIKDVAPYIAQVVSFVPGVGTGAAAALAAGIALAEGRTITDAVLAGVKSAVPGGALGKAAFDTAVSVAVKGKSALDSARAALPIEARQAFDIGTAIAHGRNEQAKVLRAVVRPTAKMAIRRTFPPVLSRSPRLAKVHRELASAQKPGFELATGLMAQRGINAHQVVAIRSTLPPDEKVGFDTAMREGANDSNPQWKSLVNAGKVSRGEWAPCRANDEGAVQGRLIDRGRAVKGCYKRVG